MAVLTPVELWVSDSPQAVELRKTLAEHWDTAALVISEGVMPQVHPSFVVALAFLQAKQDRRPPMKMFQTARGADGEAVARDFDALLKRGGGHTRFGYVLRELPLPEESLDFDRHHPDVASGRADLAGFGSLTTLRELYEAVPRVHLAGDSEWISKEELPGAVRLLGGRDILREGSIALPSDDSLWVTSPPRCLLQPGDLILRGIRGRHDRYGLIVAEVSEQDLPAAPAHTTIALRPRPSTTPQQIRLVAQFLRTPLADRLMGRSNIHLLMNRLMELPVPRPDDALTTALDDLDAARNRLETWAREADALLESAFTHKTAAQAREKIMDRGRGLRQRVEAATLLDDLGHTVRTRFPLPVAYRWRETEARMSAGEHQATYSAILETAEVLLCYTALLTLALAWEAGIPLGSTIAIREKLVGGRSGPGLGDWANVLMEAAGSRKLRALPHQHPVHAIRTLLADQDAADARERLTKRRNDDSHLRRLDPIDLPPAITEAFADLTLLVDRARFLADLPLWHVTETRWDNLTQSAQVRYRELTGDHPVVPTKTAVLTRNDLEPGSLYLRDSMHELYLLRPFLTGQVCRVCRAWSTFHADIVPGDVVQLKSLEHGHVLHQPAAAGHALSIVGLL
ncbi:restriction endonuclease [Streptomyces sp. NPDC046332]|uniref:restriction endonuclease n=1 Tax=Streptomyces sp. NPDC046332 TaxID=3155133 RepID=UPI0033E79665